MLKMKMINIEAYIQPTNLTNVTQSNLICHSKLGFFFSRVNRLNCKKKNKKRVGLDSDLQKILFKKI